MSRARRIAVALVAGAVTAGGLALAYVRSVESGPRSRAFRWCMAELPKRNYCAYYLADRWASRFTRAQRRELMAWLQADLQKKRDRFVISTGAKPPQDLLVERSILPPWGEGARRAICLPGIIDWPENVYAKELMDVLQKAQEKRGW